MNPTASQTGRLRQFIRHFMPAILGGNGEERLRACVGALIGILITVIIGRALNTSHALPWLIAPMGASAVLLFAVPSSPLAQPWSLIGGNTIAAIVGVGCWHATQDVVMASCLAAGIAIGLMLVLRCLHPPSGAVALTAVLGGPAIHDMGLRFVLDPVLLNSVCLLLTAICYNRLTGRDYPHLAPPLPAGQRRHRHTPPEERLGFSPEDIDAVLRDYNQILDVSREDLQALFMQAEGVAYRRRFGEILCGDIMARDVLHVSFATPLDEAWNLLRAHQIKALPVIDRARRVIGIVTQRDFMKGIDLDNLTTVESRLRALLKRTPGPNSDKPEVVGQIMSTPAQTATTDTHIANLVPLLGGHGHSHVPIVDAERRLAGIITPRDLVVALYRGKLQST